MNHTTFKSLNNEYELVALLHHRSKNQHRQTNWFKHLNITYRHVRKILKLQIDINRLTRKKYHSRVVSKTEEIVQISQGLIKRSKSMYFTYNSILCLGQFITLGFALLGSLAKIYSLLLEIPGVKVNKSVVESVAKEVEQHIEDDIGEVVTELTKDDTTAVDIGTVEIPTSSSAVSIVDIFSSKKKSKNKKKKSRSSASIDDILKDSKPAKKKKKKSAIDDIFG
ncbi:Ribonuclease MRP protein subunit RMP1 [Spathaspora sp. JA1]|nr:Ribonuclease MRP protein subunit RMP1 [Spathaspora sp. JA1]